MAQVTGDGYRGAEVIFPVAVLFLAIAAPLAVQVTTLAGIEADVAYNFVFHGALPALPPNRRAAFLAELGLAEQSESLAGTNAYEGRGGEAAAHVKTKLDGKLHRAAIARLWRLSPATRWRMLASAIERSGDYDLVAAGGYSSREYGGPARRAWSYSAWSEMRRRFLGGGIATLALISAWAVLSIAVVRRGLRWSTAFWVIGGGFLWASLVQIPIAIFGNGPLDLIKHLYLANLCFDVALFSTLAGLALRWMPGHDAALGPHA